MAGLREELAKLYEEHQQLTAQIVIDAARSPRHPLHARYEWNDKIAGEKYRLEQARSDIRSVQVTYTASSGDPEEVREYISVRDTENYAYRRTDEIASDPIVSSIVLRDAERAWQELRKRYGHLSEFIALVRHDVTAAKAVPARSG